jgi:hypothetical protein
VLFSFTSTCHRLGIELWAYLQDVLTRLPALPTEQVGELLPDRWQGVNRRPLPARHHLPTRCPFPIQLPDHSP